MKSKILSVAILLMATTILQAQMPKSNSEDHKKCLENCKALDNSREREICIAGCGCKCPTLNIRTLNASTKLTGIVTKKVSRNEDVLIHTDKIANGKTYADFEKGMLTGYYNITAAGAKEPCPILVYANGKAKRYFIYDTSGMYLEIPKPETPFKENVGLIAKG
jgi:hypothetical protein